MRRILDWIITQTLEGILFVGAQEYCQFLTNCISDNDGVSKREFGFWCDMAVISIFILLVNPLNDSIFHLITTLFIYNSFKWLFFKTTCSYLMFMSLYFLSWGIKSALSSGYFCFLSLASFGFVLLLIVFIS